MTMNEPFPLWGPRVFDARYRRAVVGNYCRAGVKVYAVAKPPANVISGARARRIRQLLDRRSETA